jgi:RNA polymerase sigma factor (sigma-70 family)
MDFKLALAPVRPAEGSRAALESRVTAFERELDQVYQSLRRHGLAAADAEDLVQDTFLVAWRRWEEYDPQRPLRPWLAGIAFRLAYHQRRRADREVPRGFVDVIDERPTPEDQAAGNSGRALVWRVLEALPERQRTLLRLHDIDGVPMRDVVAVLKIPLQTAHTRLRDGRRNFGRLLRRMATISEARVALRGTGLLGEGSPEPPPRQRRRRSRLGAVVPALPLVPRLVPGLVPRSAVVPGRAPRVAGVVKPRPAGGLGPAVLVLGAICGGVIAFWAVGASRASRHPSAAAPIAAGNPAPSRALLEATRAIPPRFVSVASPLDPGDERGAPAGDGLVGHWSFDDGAGSVASDESGNGNDCLIRGAEGTQRWTEGPVGGALELTGAVWLECPRVAALAALSQEVTIALWVERTGTEGGVRVLVARPLDSAGEDRFRLGFRGERVWLRSMTPGTAAGGGPLLARRRWYHLAGTLGRDGTARVFVDGVEVARRQVGGRAPVGGGSTPLVIAASLVGKRAVHRWRGVVDDLVVYDHALSASEIRALSDRGERPETSPPGPEPDPDEGPLLTPDETPAGAIAVEPESGTASAPMQVRRDPTASGGRYIAGAPGINAKEAAPSSGQAVVPFSVPEAGRYRVWGRVSAPAVTADSFWVRVDQGPWIRWNDIAAGAAWHWDVVREGREGRVATFDLTAGAHSLAIAYREDGARLDRLLLSSDPAFSPTQAGAR